MKNNNTQPNPLRFLFLFLFSLYSIISCGGGGNSPKLIVSSGDINLTSGGSIQIPEGSLPGKTSVKLSTVPLPNIVDDITPVGEAFKLETQNNEPLKLPAKITLPIPDSKNTDNLAIIRIESSGKISVLQTEVIDDMLVAYTPGFSTFVTAELKKAFLLRTARITGPDIIPVNTIAQYQEIGFIPFPGLNRHWTVFEYGDNLSANLTSIDDPWSNSLALLDSPKPGLVMIMVELSIPSTNITTIAQKYVSIQDELLAGNKDGLNINIFAPQFININEPFSFSANVLNTDISEITQWSWKLGNQFNGCSADNCNVSLDGDPIFLTVNDLSLDTPQRYKLSVSAESNGSTGTANLDIVVLDDQLRIIEIDEQKRTQERWNPKLPFLPVEVTLDAVISGGGAPYTYKWELLPTNQVVTNISDSLKDEAKFSLTQPGSYIARLTVSSVTNSTSTLETILLEGQEEVSFWIKEVPDIVMTNESFDVDFFVTGGKLIFNGEKYNYTMLVDWGDGSKLSYQSISSPSTPSESGKLTSSHSYEKPGTYTIKYGAAPSWSLHELAVIACQQENNCLFPNGSYITKTIKVLPKNTSWKSNETCNTFDALYAQKWLIDLTFNIDDNLITGKIYFHDCPGNGRVSYALEGAIPNNGQTYALSGIKTGGRGDLFTISPSTQNFTLIQDRAPMPNLSDGQK